MRRLLPLRLRVIVLTAVMVSTMVGLEAAPLPAPSDGPASAPLPLGLGPDPVLAAYCASNPTFTGRLTTSASSTTAASRITNANVYGYISNVNSAWSCTLYRRYSAIAWNTTATTGRFNWGTLINSTSVACNWVVGSTDYLKANDTADCPDSDAEYAMQVTLTAERVYQADVNHNSVGDFSFAHADCDTTPYYGDEIGKGTEASPVSFSTGTTANRPGANCDPITLDGTGTSQTITYDKTAPVLAFTTPAAAAYPAAAGAYSVTLAVTEAVAGFSTGSPWKAQRQLAALTGPNACGTFANDPATGNLTTGTTTGANTFSQTLAAATCYRWVANATDLNGNVATQVVSPTVIPDTVAPAADFSAPNEGTTSVLNGTSTSVAWSETDAHSGIASRSLQRQIVTASGTTCPTTWANDGSAVTTASPVSVSGLVDGKCYRWIVTLADRAGNTGSATSGTIRVDVGSPSANFTTPDEGTTTFSNVTTYSVAWTESAGSGSITARSLQRQKGTVVSNGTCTGVTWTNDGTASTAASPVSVTGLVSGTCYRWVQTLTNSVPKTAASTSGMVLVDTVAPTATLTLPAANAPGAADVTITGTGSDALSFKEYQLEYGAGTSPASWATIGTYTTAVTANTLATWATGQTTGAYTIRLTARDKAANSSTATRLVYLDNTGRGTESYRTRVPFDLGGGWGLDVGVANGEARLARDVFSIPSYGPSQALSLTYSSAETGAAGKFGVGWSSNLTQYLTFESGFVVWHRADGGRVPFGNVAGTWTPLAGHYETLTRGTNDTITLPDQSKLVFENTGAGRLLWMENRFGKKLTMSWGTSSATATDASGRITTLAIDSANARITSVTDSAGRAWTFAYTGTGTSSDLTSLTEPDPDGAGALAAPATTLGYTAHALTSVARTRSRVSGSPETLTWSVGYTAGKATSVTDPIDGAAATPARNKVTYGAGSTTVELLREYGATPAWNTSAYTLDTLGRVTDLVDPEGYETTTTYDANGNVTALARPIDATTSATTTRTYDTRGNLLTETTPIDASTSVVTAYTHDATNDVTSRTDADNDAATRTVTTYTYDGSGHLTSTDVNCTSSGTTIPGAGAGGSCTGAGTQDASTNLITSYAYTTNDQLSHEQDALGRVTRHVYDANGNETSVIANCTSSGTTPPSPFSSCTGAGTADHQTNGVTATAYDGATIAGKTGLPTSATDPVGNVTTFTYDTLGRRTTELLPGETGAGASIPALTRTTTYDELGNVLTGTESWTPVGGGSAVTRTTQHAYDTANRETATTVVTSPANTVTTTTYDAAGNAVSTDAGGVVTTRTFDGLGRATSESNDAGTTTHTYDAAGNELETGAAEGGTTSRTYSYTGWILTETTDPDGTPLVSTHAYDRLGRETQATEAAILPAVGAATSHTYDRVGRELTTTTPAGTTTNVYDRAGNLVATKNLDGSVTASVYDPLDRTTDTIANCTNTGTTQPAAGATCAGTGTADATTNLRTTTAYDAAGTTIAVTDARGITARTIPNVRGLAKTTIANCTDSGTTPTANPRACAGAGTADATTNVKTTTVYDGTGAVTGSTTAVGTGASATTETAYDAAGRAIAVKDPRGTISRNVYNADGQLTTTIVNCTSSGTTVPTTNWDACTGAGTQDGTYNVTTTYAYDASGNPTSVTAPNGRVTTSVYDAESRLITRIDNDVASPSGPTQDVTTSYAYDAAGRQAAVRAPSADGSTFVVTRMVYDAAGRVTRTIANCVDTNDIANCGGADGQTLGGSAFDQNVVTDYAYDDAGNLVKQTVPDPSAAAGGTGGVTTRYAYDAASRLCRVLEASTITDAAWTTAGCSGAVSGTTTTNLSTRYTYDAAGNLATAIDARGKTTRYGYDAAGRMTSVTDPDGGSLVWTYNALGQKTAQRNRVDPVLTNSVAWTYDGAGRILTRTADAATTTYTYDENGNKLTASAGSFTITATYDRLNRVLGVDDEDAGTTADTTYTYSLTSPGWTDPTGTYLVTLDAFDRPTALDEPVSTTASFTWSYRADGQPLTRGEPNGNTTTFGYDALGRASTKETKTGATSRAAYAWTRNQAGLVLSEASTITSDPTNNTRSFAYDVAGRLTAFTDGATTTAYGWAETLNRTSVQTGAGSPVATTYDDANRPLNQAGVTNAFTSDADGRLTKRPDTTGAAYQRFEWDKLGRLTTVKGASGNSAIATYTYDPLDRLRMVDYGANNRVRFRYAGLTTSAVQTINDQTGAVTRNIGTGWGGELLEDWTGSDSNWRIFGTNAHHDVTWTAGSTGSVTGTVRYDPWGTTTSVTGSVPDFRFQSSFADDTTKLSWVVTRWYAAAQGRFISEDSLLGQPRDPDSRHLYAYGGGEPVGAWDPDGRFAIVIPIAIFYVVVAAVSLLTLNAAVQTGIYLQKHPIHLAVPTLSWGKSFEEREVDKLRAKYPGEWIQPQVWFWTDFGARTMDACRYPSVWHFLASPWKSATQCFELKSTIASRNDYLNNKDNQLVKDRWISRTHGISILLVNAGCWWSNGYLNCYRSAYP